MALNELDHVKLWGGVLLFVIIPTLLTIFVWLTTAAPGNEYGTGNWFKWAKTYSALAGCIGFMLLRYLSWTDKKPSKTINLYEKKWALAYPALILTINMRGMFP